MNKLAIVFLSILFSHSAFSICMERFYSEAHLQKQKGRQEIRTAVVDIEGYSPDFIFYADSDSKTKLDLIVTARKNENSSKILVGKASGYCKAETRKLAYCDLNGFGENSTKLELVDQGEHKEGKTIRKMAFLFTLPKNFKYKNLTYGAKEAELSITDYDNTIRVYSDDSYSIVWGGGANCASAIKLPATVSTERLWNEVILYSIRNDLARPTVTARNLFHLSTLMWDVYSNYFDKKTYYSYGLKRPAVKDLDADYQKALSFAAYTLLKERYKSAPGNGDLYPETDGGAGDGVEDKIIQKSYEKVMKTLGYSLNTEDPHALFGIRMAQSLLQEQFDDGSRERENYAAEETYVLKNSTIIDVSQSGFRVPLALDEETDVFIYKADVLGKIFGDRYHEMDSRIKDDTYLSSAPTELSSIDIDHWIRLNIPGSIDQGGNAQASEQSPLTVFWGRLPTFSDLSPYKSRDKKGVYFDPGEHLPSFKDQPDKVIEQNLQVMLYSALLNPADLSDKDFDRDGKADINPGFEQIDISPASLGNSELGTNKGKGHAVNPVTGQAYAPNYVKAADYYRSIAEFWADGPESETPPGHWNTLANYVLDQLKTYKTPLRWENQGAELSEREYSLRLYLTLNGALHDAAVVAWGIKGHYQGNRPVSVLRYLAAKAESDPAFAKKLVSYAPDHLKMVTYTKPYLDKKGEIQEKEVTKLAAKAWRGPGFSAFYNGDFDGGGQVELRDFSYRLRDNLAQEENEFYNNWATYAPGEGGFYSGVGWILLENWLPYQRQTFVTPPFPGFISGHSTFSRAAAEVLAGATGSKFFPGGMGTYKAPELHFEPNSGSEFEFQWATYYDASDASGISRLYGGIHASYDDLPARVIGSKVGKEAVKKARQIFE